MRRSLSATSLAGPWKSDGADPHDVGAIGDLKGLVDVLLDDQHVDAEIVADPAQHLEEFAQQDRCQPQRRLVEQHEFRFRHQTARDRQLALLAAGQGAGELLAALGQDREPLQHLLHALAHALHIAVEEEAATDLKVLLDGHARQDGLLRGDVGDAEPGHGMGLHAVDAVGALLVEELDDPPGRLDEPHDGLEHAGLAGSVGAQQRDDLALADLEGHVGSGDHGAVADLEALDPENGAVGVAHCPSPKVPPSPRDRPG